MIRLGATTFTSFYPRAIYRVPSRRHHDHHHWKGSIILLYFPPPTTDYHETIIMTGNKVKLRSNLSPSRVTRAGSVPRYAGKKGGLVSAASVLCDIPWCACHWPPRTVCDRMRINQSIRGGPTIVTWKIATGHQLSIINWSLHMHYQRRTWSPGYGNNRIIIT